MGLFKKKTKDYFSSGITAWDEECQRKTPTDRDHRSEKKGRDHQKSISKELSGIEKMRKKYTY